VEERAQELVASLGGLQRQLERFQRSYELVGRHLENAGKQYAESDRLYTRLQDHLDGLTGISADSEKEQL
jgi:phage-related tail protein